MPATNGIPNAKRPTMPRATYSLTDVCGMFEIGYSTAWTMLQDDTFPVKPIKIGRQYRFPKSHIDRLLGLDDTGPDAA